MIRAFLFVFIFLASTATSYAVLPGEMLKDPALELRARGISQGLRCLVCQNQAIDDSDAPLAKDLRMIVREKLTAGDSDAQVVDYMVRRYGNYVLLKPPLQTNTLLLWLLPFILMLLGLFISWRYLRQLPEPDAGEMTNEILKGE